MVVATGWAIAVLCGVLVAQAFGSPGAHLIPPSRSPRPSSAAITRSRPDPVVGSDCSDAMSGSALMALHFAPHWRPTPDPAAKLGIFCTGPAIKSPLANIASEIIGTMVLVVVAGAIFSHGVSATGPAAGIGPWLVASLVWGIGLSLGGTTGYAINPARDLGPRLVHGLLPIPGKGGSNWRYAPIPIVGGRWAERLPGCCSTTRTCNSHAHPQGR